MDIKAAKAVMAEVTRIYRAGKDGEEVFRLLELSEQMAKEHAAAVEALKKEGESLKADNSRAKERLLKAIGEAEKVLADAASDAQAMKDKATQDAASTQDSADKALAAILDETNTTNTALKEVKAGFAEACKELAEIENKIEAAKKAMTTALKGL